MIDMQIRIYLCFKPSSAIKAELFEFYWHMKKNAPELMGNFTHTSSKVILIGDGIFYYPLAKLYSRKERVLG
jgi:hypothetical protein